MAELDLDASGSQDGATARRMATAAAELLAVLSPAQRQKAVFPFDPADDERTRWHYAPSVQGGLPLGEMNPAQQQLAHRLVASGLSPVGYVTAAAIMGLENILDAREQWRANGYPGAGGASRNRDAGMYFLSIFGEPGDARPWGWRYNGHHISLHYTLVEGRIAAATPLFFGANPAEAAFVGGALLRPLGAEEDLGRTLLLALDERQRAVAVLAPAAPPDIVQANRVRVEVDALPQPPWEIANVPLSPAAQERRKVQYAQQLAALGLRDEHFAALRYSETPAGLAAARMNGSQHEVLTALIRQYIDRLPDELAAAEAVKLLDGALGAVHFAWAGDFEHGKPHYYRLQGPRFLVEYDNTQNDANHIHAVWRDPQRDFAADLLAQHYAQSH